MDDDDAAEIKSLLKEIRDNQKDALELGPHQPQSGLAGLRSGLRRTYQISVKSSLLITFWVALWFGAVRASNSVSNSLLEAMCSYVVIVAPAAALGAALNQPFAGFIYGSASGIVLAAWILLGW